MISGVLPFAPCASMSRCALANKRAPLLNAVRLGVWECVLLRPAPRRAYDNNVRVDRDSVAMMMIVFLTHVGIRHVKSNNKKISHLFL